MKQVFRITKEHHYSLSCRSGCSKSSQHRSPLMGPVLSSGSEMLGSKNSPACIGPADINDKAKYLSSTAFKDGNTSALIDQLAQGEQGNLLAQRMRLPSH